MSYKSIGEINQSLKGIKPPITLEQANEIAAAAEKIGTDEEKNGWAIAISNFKKNHTVRKGKWVKREETKSENEPVQAMTETTESYSMVAEPVYGAVSFEQLDQARQVGETTEKLAELLSDLNAMMQNVIYSPEANKMKLLSDLYNGFMVRVREIIQDPGGESAAELAMAESNAMDISGEIMLEEIEAGKPVLFMDIIPIKVGWGNTRDNNYYPRQMLEDGASKFVGAKMYETDHKPDEKSTRTWVSTITAIKGFTSEGNPIAKVAVHDPGFAERMRNLKQAGIVEKMECSIFGSAKGKPGFEKDGRSGKLIEAITDIASVDWVTKAGAGGHVVGLSEKAFEKIEEQIMKTETEIVNASPVIEAKQTPEKSAEEPIFLSEAEVRQELVKSKLPSKAAERIALAKFANAEALQSAIKSEAAYIAEIAQSGQVFGLAENSSSKATALPVAEAMKLLYEKYPL